MREGADPVKNMIAHLCVCLALSVSLSTLKHGCGIMRLSATMLHRGYLVANRDRRDLITLCRRNRDKAWFRYTSFLWRTARVGG